MDKCKQRIIYERSNIIPIPNINQNINQNKNQNINQNIIKKKDLSINEYSLKQKMFDPSKNSPPNDFMIKLKLRMTYYDSFNSFDNFIKE
jgi:hypothetical protein